MARRVPSPPGSITVAEPPDEVEADDYDAYLRWVAEISGVNPEEVEEGEIVQLESEFFDDIPDLEIEDEGELDAEGEDDEPWEF